MAHRIPTSHIPIASFSSIPRIIFLQGIEICEPRGEDQQRTRKELWSRQLQLSFRGMGSHEVVQGHSQELSLPSSYEMAMEALSSLISKQKRGDRTKREGKRIGGKFHLMNTYLKILGVEEHINRLKIIHVAGTKGKGSTCRFCESILHECGFRTGLFTSPHLIDVRERYRIGGLDISEDKFLRYFWDCWNQLKGNFSEDLPMPPLFQFLTLLAFKIFISEKVDVAIIEVGLGGQWDSTNVVKEPIVCGVTSLGMDHMEILGDSLCKIAFQKAGIFKPQVPAFTVPQLSEAMDALQEKAAELMIPLKVALPLDLKKLDGCKLGLAGDHQLINAGLAVALCQCWLQNTGNSEVFFQNENLNAALPQAFIRGLSVANFPGRAQIVCDKLEISGQMAEAEENSSGDLIFYLDGAHTPESMEVCARWFSSAVTECKQPYINEQRRDLHECYDIRHENSSPNGSKKISKQILLFNCMEVRDPQLLFPKLVNTCASSAGVHFSKALFVPSISSYNKVNSAASVVPSNVSKDVSWQSFLQRTWEKIIHGKDAIVNDDSKLENPVILPSYDFLFGDSPQKCNPVSKQFLCSAVIPSLPMALKWLRDCARENPSVRVQVLVTGSLHLVGDVLKLLRR